MSRQLRRSSFPFLLACCRIVRGYLLRGGDEETNGAGVVVLEEVEVGVAAGDVGDLDGEGAGGAGHRGDGVGIAGGNSELAKVAGDGREAAVRRGLADAGRQLREVQRARARHGVRGRLEGTLLGEQEGHVARLPRCRCRDIEVEDTRNRCRHCAIVGRARCLARATAVHRDDKAWKRERPGIASTAGAGSGDVNFTRRGEGACRSRSTGAGRP